MPDFDPVMSSFSGNFARWPAAAIRRPCRAALEPYGDQLYCWHALYELCLSPSTQHRIVRYAYHVRTHAVLVACCNQLLSTRFACRSALRGKQRRQQRRRCRRSWQRWRRSGRCYTLCRAPRTWRTCSPCGRVRSCFASDHFIRLDSAAASRVRRAATSTYALPCDRRRAKVPCLTSRMLEASRHFMPHRPQAFGLAIAVGSPQAPKTRTRRCRSWCGQRRRALRRRSGAWTRCSPRASCCWPELPATRIQTVHTPCIFATCGRPPISVLTQMLTWACWEDTNQRCCPRQMMRRILIASSRTRTSGQQTRIVSTARRGRCALQRNRFARAAQWAQTTLKCHPGVGEGHFDLLARCGARAFRVVH